MSRTRVLVSLSALSGLVLIAIAGRDAAPPHDATRSATAAAHRVVPRRETVPAKAARAPLADGGHRAAIPRPTAESGRPPRPFRLSSSGGFTIDVAWVVPGSEPAARRVALTGDASLPPDLVPPFRVWAAGHAEVEVRDAGTREIELDPEFSLEVHGPGLSAAIRAVAVNGAPAGDLHRGGDALLWERWGDDAFGLAVHWERAGRTYPLGVDVHLTDQARELHRISPARGARGAYRVELDLPERTIVSILPRAACPDDPTSTLELVSWAERRYPRVLGRGRAFAWGELYHQTHWAGASSIEPGRPARVALGPEYGISARCRSCGAYGRVYSTPTERSTEVDVPMRRGARITGRLSPGMWDRVDVEWRFGPAGRDVSLPTNMFWNGESRLELGRGGGFRLTLPEDVPMPRVNSWPMPSIARLVFSAPGCDPLEVVLDVGRGGPFDVGLLPLEPREPAITLAPGHGLDPEAVKCVRVTPFGGRDGELGCSGSRACSDGALAVYLEDRDAEASFTRGSTPASVLVCESGEAAAAFRLDGARFVPVGRVETCVELIVTVFPPGRDEITLGWTWDGIDYPVRVVDRDDLDRSPSWTFTHPEGADRVWWSTSRWRPDAGQRGRVARLQAPVTTLAVP